MRIVSYNVNSIRARKERVLSWLERTKPAVVCLQETKITDDKFPADELKDLGYHSLHHGQPTYNGVAILSRQPITEMQRGLPGDEDDTQARFIHGQTYGLDVMSAYIPNGKTTDSDKYQYKQKWLQRLADYLGTFNFTSQAALCGDFNLSADDRDVHDPSKWKDSVLYTPVMRSYYKGLTEAGWIDSMRLRRDEPGIYTWWDYRGSGYEKNDGLRIDYVFLSPLLALRVDDVGVDVEEREGEKPSDHAPVWADVVKGWEG